jgi:hypothetical protein
MAGKKGRTGKKHTSTKAKRGGKKDRRFKRNKRRK